MHDAERADEHAEADAVPEPEKRDHDAEIEDRFGKEQETVQQRRRSDLSAEIAAYRRFPIRTFLTRNG